MPYSQPEGAATFFSHDRDILLEFNSEIRGQLDDAGGEYEGPFPFPQIDMDQVDRFLICITQSDDNGTDIQNEFPDWLFEVARSSENRELLVEASKLDRGLYARGYRFVGDRIVKVGFSVEPPPSVGVLAELDQRTHKKGDYDPATWNPNLDHIPSHPDGSW